MVEQNLIEPLPSFHKISEIYFKLMLTVQRFRSIPQALVLIWNQPKSGKDFNFEQIIRAYTLLLYI